MPLDAQDEPNLVPADPYRAANQILADVVPSKDGVPDWIQLTPKRGAFEGRDGRRFDVPDPKQLVTAFNAASEHLILDIDHRSEDAHPFNALNTTASGWITELATRNRGQIWARVEFTDDGRNLVEEREYRSVSPVFQITRDSREAFIDAPEKNSMEVTAILSVALTNRPNLRIRSLNTQNDNMDPEILASLGLGTDAKDADVLAAVNDLKASNASVPTDLTQYVPRADLDNITAQLNTANLKVEKIETDRFQGAVNRAIDDAVKHGKITPATVDYHRATCSSEESLARFVDYAKSLPAVVEPNGEQAGHAKSDALPVVELNESDKSMARNWGLDESKMLEQKVARAGGTT